MAIETLDNIYNSTNYELHKLKRIGDNQCIYEVRISIDILLTIGEVVAKIAQNAIRWRGGGKISTK